MIFASVDGRLAVDTQRSILLDGCFDPLHHAHVRYVREAKRAFPDWPLVVGVASDDEIRSKGREPLLPQMARCAVVDGLQGVDTVIAKDRPTHEIISALKPGAFVKGKDWDGKLSPEILAACSLNDVQIVYLGETLDSSTDRLRAWALKDAEQSLDRLEAFVAAQQATPVKTFDEAYFLGEWRGDAPYTYESRKKAEGRHPKIVKELFDGLSVLDVGCGPGHFVRMLREVGMDAGGIDPSRAAVAMSNGIADRVVCGNVSELPPKIAQVVICREVLEHVPIIDIPEMIFDLFRVARKYVYLTTRFTHGSVFDAATDFDTDPTHISLLTQPFLRSLCVLNGGNRRRDLETRLDHMEKRRCLVYEVQ